MMIWHFLLIKFDVLSDRVMVSRKRVAPLKKMHQKRATQIDVASESPDHFIKDCLLYIIEWKNIHPDKVKEQRKEWAPDQNFQKEAATKIVKKRLWMQQVTPPVVNLIIVKKKISLMAMDYSKLIDIKILHLMKIKEKLHTYSKKKLTY